MATSVKVLGHTKLCALAAQYQQQGESTFMVDEGLEQLGHKYIKSGYGEYLLNLLGLR